MAAHEPDELAAAMVSWLLRFSVHKGKEEKMERGAS
jgi:hypothetical protein